MTTHNKSDPQWSDEDACYVARDGNLAAHGDTPEEAAAELLVAMRAVAQVLRTGDAQPKRYKTWDEIKGQRRPEAKPVITDSCDCDEAVRLRVALMAIRDGKGYGPDLADEALKTVDRRESPIPKEGPWGMTSTSQATESALGSPGSGSSGAEDVTRNWSPTEKSAQSAAAETAPDEARSKTDVTEADLARVLGDDGKCPTCKADMQGHTLSIASGTMALHCPPAPNACVADSEWGCEARKKLGIARGVLSKIADGEAGDEQAFEWQDFYASLKEEAREAFEATGQPQPCVPATPTPCEAQESPGPSRSGVEDDAHALTEAAEAIEPLPVEGGLRGSTVGCGAVADRPSRNRPDEGASVSPPLRSSSVATTWEWECPRHGSSTCSVCALDTVRSVALYLRTGQFTRKGEP